MLFLRKIKPEAWISSTKYDSDSISDLVTTNHELSVWYILDIKDKNSVDRTALALAMCLNKPVALMMVIIDSDKLTDHRGRQFKIDLTEQEGDTRFKKMKDKHVNFMIPSIFEMGHLAANIHNLIQDPANMLFYNEDELKDLFYKAYENKEIDINDLKDTKWNTLLKVYLKEKGVS